MPKDRRRHRVAPSTEWVEVRNIPYTGKSPDLPKLSDGRKYHAHVAKWWEAVRRMPHCALWTETEWLYAIETAVRKQVLWELLDRGHSRTQEAADITRREVEMGTTRDARRKLRIRYVEPDGSFSEPYESPEITATPEAEAGTVTQIDSRRRRLAG